MQLRVGNSVRRGRQSVLLTALLVVGGAAVGMASEPGDDPSERSPIHWGYSAENGPARWDALSPDWALCGKGRSQSPVDLGGAKPAGAVELSFGYEPASLKIIHHEHVVDVLNNGPPSCGGLLITGFLAGVVGLIWRLLWYRREVALTWDEESFRLVGRSEFFSTRFARELRQIHSTLGS